MKLPYFILFLATAAFGQGTLLWDESVNGPFSPDFQNPTSLQAFQLGTNSIFGKSEIEPNGNNWLRYPDYFRVTVPNNTVVAAVFLTIDKSSVWSWVGDANYLSQLGYTASSTSGALFPQWGLFSLGPGAYGMYMDNHDQQTFTSVANYRLDFFVEAVPEPGTISLTLLGLGLFAPSLSRNASSLVVKLPCLILFLATAAFGQGTLLWDESVNGPFSDGTTAPTFLGSLQFGTNSVIGTTEIEPTGNTWLVHYDVFASVPANSAVSSVRIQIDKANVWTWIGDPSLSSQLAFSGSPSSGDLLAQWGLNRIDSGSFAMYMANHDAQPFTSMANYRLDFFVQVPEPGTISLTLVGLGLFALRFRATRHRPQ